MQKLSDQLENLSVSHEPTVGVFYHPDMLLHKPVKFHPENPDRLTGILSHLEKQNLLSRCKVYSDFDSVPKEVVTDLHGENYVDYVEGLWDDNIEREVRFYKDTYYNKHSIRAANLAANALKLAVDEMFAGKINRAYGIVRPPGHHAAADNNRISGFCIYNNVALAAKYAAKKYGVKRILIYDWDVHHGDSTSRFFYEDASVLYISLHRYDNGNFYPGKFGDMKNIGENQGKGYNLNLTWSLPHPYCIVGDHEYVYANERVFLPIIKEFDPELIFISAGFDSSRGDPIGGIDLTQDGYAYMTKRLLDFAPARTIIALEGGYNVNSISVASEACLRILLGEEMPLKCCEHEETLNAMVFKCAPSDLVIQTVKSAIEIYQEYWPVLTKDQSVLTYESECLKRTSSTEIEIAAGHKDAVIIKQDKFLKRLKESEVKLYKDLSDIHDGDYERVEYLEESKELLKFASKCTGMTKIDGRDYAILENICYMHPKASVIDFKIGRVTYLPTHSDKVKNEHIVKAEKTISSKLGFRISGLLLKDRHGKLMHKAYKNEIYYDITTSNIGDHIARFLKSNDASNINIEAAKYYANYLSEMVEFFETKNTRAWIGTSVLLVLDNTTNYFKATWIDIGKYLPLDAGEKDQNILEGLKNLHQILNDLANLPQV